ncbi:MAG TPA: alanine--glyoxylate aminotransferase family protein [Gemmataceae bacterium]|nr:alanine--glyoxylate aminotransferase family protein [Gemmataceae bacterium]
MNAKFANEVFVMKQRLLTPGPTPVPEETLLELARPMIYHRTAEFRAILKEVLEDLQYVFQTKNLVIPLTASGTGGLEAALVNSVPPGGKVICLIAGRFGERWKSIAKAFGIEAVTVQVPYGQVVTPEMLSKALVDHPDAIAVASTLSETSTGAGHDIEAMGKIVAKTPALFLVDAISGLGAMECRTDDWHIDMCCTGSQKALMMPPGLAFLTVSDKAWKAIDKNPSPRTFYFDLKKARKNQEGGDTPFTPAHTLIRAMRVSLKKIKAEGIENIWATQARNAAAARAAFQALGLKIFPVRPNNALTVGEMPPGIDSSVLLGKLEKQYGLKLANGQDTLKGKVIRLAHMGHIDQFDIITAISGLELALAQMGHKVEPGAGVAAAQRVWAAASRNA